MVPEITHWLHNLSEERTKSTMSERALARIANEMYDIIGVGAIMGISQTKIHQYQDTSPHSVKQQFILMFTDWRRFAPDTSVGQFVRLMREADVDDAIVKRAIDEEDDNTVRL
ncbi:hypothetical protein NP493_117g03000 [Ridgeia piscesae]|uniref:Death domain-containing protein n=1 Tax=Ridgeia piscesae TaxID=27915 RepID=A0AAD9UGU1_RIDPI|nr:hypothetical protein NP493_117g03000 [Ridgeia piscesae]